MNIKKILFCFLLIGLGSLGGTAEAQMQFVNYYVDDNAPHDPDPNNPLISDPNEDGSMEHPFDSIQEAVDYAIDGDTILVAEGTYYENVDVNDLDITLTSTQPDDPAIVAATILDGRQAGSVITITDSNSVIEGLTITNGLAEQGGGIFCQSGYLELYKCIVINNYTLNGLNDIEAEVGDDGGHGGGLYCISSSILLKDSIISNNQTGIGGETPFIWPPTRGGNGGDGAGIYCISTSIVVDNCLISDNLTGDGGIATVMYSTGGDGGDGAGILCFDCSRVEIVKSQILFNATGESGRGGTNHNPSGNGGDGAGIFCFDCSGVEIVNSQISFNATGCSGPHYLGSYGGNGGNGAGLYLKNISGTNITNCEIVDNTTGDGGEGYISSSAFGGDGGSGAGIFVSSSSDVQISQSLILSNQTGRGGHGKSIGAGHGGNGGGIYGETSGIQFCECTISENVTGSGGRSDWDFSGSGGSGAGVFCSGLLELTKCLIFDNTTGDGGNAGGGISGVAVIGGDGGNGAGIWCSGLMELAECLVYENTTGKGGNGNTNCVNNPFNKAGDGGNGAGVWCSSGKIISCSISSNKTGIKGNGCTLQFDGDDGLGGGVFTGSSTVLANTIIWNNLYNQVTGLDCSKIHYCDISDGICSGMNGNLFIDPLFADPNHGDFHLKSQAGRWDTAVQEWVYDEVTSPCIDGGDPNDPGWMNELWPHGKRINMGAYGGTPEASLSSNPAGSIADLNHDGSVDILDLDLLLDLWTLEQNLLPEDLDRNGRVNQDDFVIFSQNWLWEDVLTVSFLNSLYSFCADQLTASMNSLTVGAYPAYTQNYQYWAAAPSWYWSGGFFPGCLWLIYEASGNPVYKTGAQEWTAGLESQAYLSPLHDVGFLILTSFGNGYRITGDPNYREVLLAAADTLSNLYNPTIGAINLGWGDWESPIAIDTMMNIELLYWASKNGGPVEYAQMASNHAYTTLDYLVREDGSTYQFADFDSETGQLLFYENIQGYDPNSTWSRGQAWAVYGFTVCYRETGDPNFLAAAERAANFYVHHLPEDRVPYWDFVAPLIPNTERDTSAAAIAAAGLLELNTLSGNPAARASYWITAYQTLVSLCTPVSEGGYLGRDPLNQPLSPGLLMHGCHNHPESMSHGTVSDESLIWGDYYFLEALSRLQNGL